MDRPLRSKLLGRLCGAIGSALLVIAKLPIVVFAFLSNSPPPDLPKTLPESSRASLGCFALAAAVGLVDLVLWFVSKPIRLYWLAAIFATMGIAGLLGSYLVHCGQRLSADDGWDDLDSSPALLLRSFDADRAGLFSKSFEVKLAEALANVEGLGPLIAIGKPGEMLQTLGAKRLYTDGGSWQAMVAELIHRAKLIFLVAGETSGLNWEIQKLVDVSPARKVIFVFPSHSDTFYASFREQCLAVGVDLPAEQDFGPLIGFHDNWQARRLSREHIPRSLVPRVLCFGFPAAIYELLRPVSYELGISLPAIPLSPKHWMGLAITVTGVTLGLFAIVHLLFPTLFARSPFAVAVVFAVILIATLAAIFVWPRSWRSVLRY